MSVLPSVARERFPLLFPLAFPNTVCLSRPAVNPACSHLHNDSLRLLHHPVWHRFDDTRQLYSQKQTLPSSQSLPCLDWPGLPSTVYSPFPSSHRHFPLRVWTPCLTCSSLPAPTFPLLVNALLTCKPSVQASLPNPQTRSPCSVQPVPPPWHVVQLKITNLFDYLTNTRLCPCIVNSNKTGSMTALLHILVSNTWPSVCHTVSALILLWMNEMLWPSGLCYSSTVPYIEMFKKYLSDWAHLFL